MGLFNNLFGKRGKIPENNIKDMRPQSNNDKELEKIFNKLEYKIKIHPTIISETISKMCSDVYENTKMESNFNLIITTNTRISKLFTKILILKGLKKSFINIGGQTPYFNVISQINSLGFGNIHYLIGTSSLIYEAINNYTDQTRINIPKPPYLSEENSKINLCLIEPEFMSYTGLKQAFEIGIIFQYAFLDICIKDEKLTTKNTHEQTLYLFISKENASREPKFEKIINNNEGEKLHYSIITAIGIKDILIDMASKL